MIRWPHDVRQAESGNVVTQASGKNLRIKTYIGGHTIVGNLHMQANVQNQRVLRRTAGRMKRGSCAQNHNVVNQTSV